MSPPLESQILNAEEQLRLAMLQSDVSALSQLLAPDLIFTNHLGQVLKKQDDLIAHQSGALNIRSLTPSEQRIQFSGEVAIVSVRVHLVGSYAGKPSDSDFRFTRIWSRSSDGAWQVVVAHSSLVTASGHSR
ncbi:MAG: nuclear transport factor 2 family protein [Cyanobacteria bacterium P01_A01_bin.114]